MCTAKSFKVVQCACALCMIIMIILLTIVVVVVTAKWSPSGRRVVAKWLPSGCQVVADWSGLVGFPWKEEESVY